MEWATENICRRWNIHRRPSGIESLTYGGYKRWIKGILGKSEQNTRFSNTWVTNKKQFEKKIISLRHNKYQNVL